MFSRNKSLKSAKKKAAIFGFRKAIVKPCTKPFARRTVASSFLSIFFDRNLNFVKEFKLRGVPTTVLINKKGEEFARIIGAVDFQDKKFSKWLLNYD